MQPSKRETYFFAAFANVALLCYRLYYLGAKLQVLYIRGVLSAAFTGAFV